jgi:hypothetical protein
MVMLLEKDKCGLAFKLNPMSNSNYIVNGWSSLRALSLLLQIYHALFAPLLDFGPNPWLHLWLGC